MYPNIMQFCLRGAGTQHHELLHRHHRPNEGLKQPFFLFLRIGIGTQHHELPQRHHKPINMQVALWDSQAPHLGLQQHFFLCLSL